MCDQSITNIKLKGLFRGVRGAVRLGYEAKSEPIQKIKYVRFSSVRLMLKKNQNQTDPI